MRVGMGAWVELRRFAQVRSQEKQQEMEEQFISNLFSSYQGHLKWNPIPHEDFLTREFANMLLSFNGSSVAIHSPDSISLDFEPQHPSYQTATSFPTVSLARTEELAENVLSNILHVIQEEAAQASALQSHANREANSPVAFEDQQCQSCQIICNLRGCLPSWLVSWVSAFFCGLFYPKRDFQFSLAQTHLHSLVGKN